MFVLLQRRLVTPELYHNEEDGAHSLPRGDSVLTTAHIPIHNLLHPLCLLSDAEISGLRSLISIFVLAAGWDLLPRGA